jgi:hypothetical protein
MTKVVGDYHPRSISQYVPNMEYASDVVGDVSIVYLGSPAALDADGIFDGVSATNSATSYTSADFKTTFDGSSTSLTTTSGMIDATYGRCLTATGSSGSNHVVTVKGRDYLGQRMQENLTLSGTTVIFGNKAFKFIDSMDIAAGATGDTMDLGWFDRLGLPYKTERIVGYTEDDVTKPHEIAEVSVEVDAVRFAAGTDCVVPSPLAGQITGVNSVVTTATSGDSTGTVVVGSTDVAGLSIVIAGSSGVAVLDSDTATTDDDQGTSTVAKFGAVGISPDSTPTGGAANYTITVEPLAFVAGDDTATQTATTEDTRGTIRVTSACDGSISYEARCKVNTTDLHGIEQYNG